LILKVALPLELVLALKVFLPTLMETVAFLIALPLLSLRTTEYFLTFMDFLKVFFLAVSLGVAF
jgi:hypothetical protein